MRKVGLIVLALGVVALGLLGLRRAGIPGGGDVLPPATAEAAPALPDFTPVQVQAADEGLALSGRVVDGAGQPVPGAQVQLAAASQQSLATATCAENHALLLACRARETGPVLQGLLERGQGLLVPGASTRADAEGRFRFDRLVGVSFTVWAVAPGHGAAVRERAAPGEPVELFLPSPRTLAGSITDEAGRGVAGARVWAVSRRLPLRHEVRAGPDGRFLLTGLGEGPFTLVATAPGLLPATVGPVEAAGEPARLVLPAPRALEVAVRRDGRPVEARVRLEAGHLHREALAKEGLARFEGLYPGALLVMGTAGSASAVPLRAQLREALTRVTLELEEGGRLLVTAVDPGGEPVPTPRLRLWTPAGERVEERRADTGELVVFGPLGPGDYVLTGEAEGFADAELPVRLKPGELQVELPMRKGTLLAGRVLDVYGRPAPGVSVLVQPTGDGVLADEEGRFSTLVPSPGIYTLHAHHSDWGGTERSVSAPDTAVELSLEPKASVEVVVQAGGRRVEGASVVLALDPENVFRSDRTSGPDGRLPMRGLPAGTYQLTATHPDFLPSERVPVTVEDGQTLGVTVELRAGERLEGDVVDEGGAPVVGASVGVVPRLTALAQTDGVGRATRRAPPPARARRGEGSAPGYAREGRVTATAGAGERVRLVMRRRSVFRGRVLGEDGQPVRRYRLNDRDVVGPDGRFELPLGERDGAGGQVLLSVEAPGFEPLVVERPVQPELGDLVLKRAAVLAGQVREPGGAPVAEAVVSCDVCDESVLSGADGRFSLSRPAYVAQYAVTAEKGGMSGSATVQRTQESVDVVVRPASRLSGTVYGTDGRPAVGVAVTVMAPGRGEERVAVTGADGRYALDVPAGTYSLAAGTGTGPYSGAAVLTVVVGEGGARADLGPAPGTASLAVRMRPERGRALWVVPGELGAVANPFRELMGVPLAQMAYQPGGERLVFHGLQPGRYTVVWGHLHGASGPAQTRVVEVPRQAEVDLAGGS